MSAPIAPAVPAPALMVAAILATWHRATASDREAGATWYGSDATITLNAIVGAAHAWRPGFTMAHAAAVVSHLSPRTTWARNVAAAVALVTGGAAGALAVGAMRANVARALIAADSATPLETFGRNAHKTRAFARNLLGDRDAVTVDVWAARVAGIDDERTLKRVGAYAAVADAYRAAAAAVGVDATTMQATTWVVARNGRAG